MNAQANTSSELFVLLGELADERLGDAGQSRLLELLRDDEDARTSYLEYMELHARLQWKHGSEHREPAAECPVVSVFSSSQPGVGSGWALSYMVATVVLAAMLLGAWAYKISHVGFPQDDVAVERQAVPLISPDYVGRITGMKDCRWGEGEPGTIVGASVPLRRKYILESGLLQITYATGANVILEGPCEYVADSDTGGYLRVGKLVARVEKNDELRMMNDESHGRNSDIHHSSFINHPLFSVRTPTAIVTDLGTEFGVEVDKNGYTESHVIQGKVEVKILNGDDNGKNRVCLAAGDAVRVESAGRAFISVPFAADRFVRRLSVRQDGQIERAYMKAVLADRPMGYWPLNDNASSRKFLDRSKNAFHGMALGNVYSAEGPFPGGSLAVELKGDGYIDVGRQDRFALDNGFTVEAWAWIANPTGKSGRIISAAGCEGPRQRYGWAAGYCGMTDPKTQGDEPFCVFTRYGRPGTVYHREKMPLRQWLHLAYVFGTDNSLRIYLNGELWGDYPSGEPAERGPTWVSIGWGANVDGEYWRGRLAHVAVYPAELSASQIQNHFHFAEKENKRTDK